MDWWMGWPRAFETSGKPARWIIPYASWWGNECFSIACCYPDANDSARLSEDPIHKLLLDRDPIEGRDLASRPDIVAFRERSWGKGTLSPRRVPGRECDPAARQAAAPSHSRHHRSGSDR